MTTIGQVTTGGRYHLNLHGLAACGAGTGRILHSTVIPATSATAYGNYCKRCQRAMARTVTIDEVAAAVPNGGYKIRKAGRGFMAFGPSAQNWDAASPWEALAITRRARGAQVRAARAAKAERERAAQQRAAVAHLHCQECGRRLSDQDLMTPVVPGYCFDCA